MLESMVVSEIGEQWSPKTPPPRAAAIVMYTSAPIPLAMGTAMEIMIAKVPQDVPGEKAIKQLTKKTIKGIKCNNTLSKNQRGAKRQETYTN